MLDSDPRQQAKELVERGLEGAHDTQADYARLRRGLRVVQLGLAVTLVVIGVLVYFVATTATSADQRSTGTLRFLEGKQGAPGKPGESGAIGQRGLRGPGPTQAQIDAAVRRCGARCRGRTGAAGPRGRRGAPGPTPTFAQVLRAAQLVCARGACKGDRGRDPTPREIVGAVVLYCQVKVCKGEKGDTGARGADGPEPKAFVFTDAGGQQQECVDPNGDGRYACTVVTPVPVLPAPAPGGAVPPP